MQLNEALNLSSLILSSVNNLDWKNILNSSALILSIVNGIMLFMFYIRDKAKLTIHLIHPEVYQWWFKLPDGEYAGNQTRRYGFLAYIGISNSGLRKVSLQSWRLFIKTEAFRQVELKPISISEPTLNLNKSGHIKIFPVLGQKGSNFDGDTLVDSGTSISGMIYYIAEFYGENVWNPRIKDGKITGKLAITDAFNNKIHCNIVFSEKSLEEIKSIVESIDKIG